MTPEEWTGCDDPGPMLHFARHRLGPRKLRLFACACCRLVWDALPGDWSRQAVEIAERYADDEISEAELAHHYREINRRLAGLGGVSGRLGQATAELLRPRFSAVLVAERARTGPLCRGLPGLQAKLLRDIAEDPFRRPVLGPAFQTDSLIRLAEEIIRGRTFADLPLLADALEEAGCVDRRVLDHCRGPGPHVRGCWVLDLVCGKD